MSNTDSFIEEVTEEVRRDRLYAALRKYGWIGAVAVLAIVGGAAYSEYNKAQVRAQAEAAGDAMLAAMTLNESADRAAALALVDLENPSANAIVSLMTAAEQSDAGQTVSANETLQGVATTQDLPLIYRQIASFKALALSADDLSADERQSGYEALSQPGNPLRLLAQEQLALIDIEAGDADAALVKFQGIIDDSETTSDLQQRALQVMVALGAEPDLTQLTQGGN
jgi:hypothetical protein|tara:strand:+ start:3654 stop:4331 length:678 start_codon:yes stop_codon:yes gene_type:complete